MAQAHNLEAILAKYSEPLASDAWPLWLAQDQIGRLKGELESAGFVNVAFEAAGNDALNVRVFTGTDDGPEHAVIVRDPKGLSNVVERFKKWREQRRG